MTLADVLDLLDSDQWHYSPTPEMMVHAIRSDGKYDARRLVHLAMLAEAQGLINDTRDDTSLSDEAKRDSRAIWSRAGLSGTLPVAGNGSWAKCSRTLWAKLGVRATRRTCGASELSVGSATAGLCVGAAVVIGYYLLSP